MRKDEIKVIKRINTEEVTQTKILINLPKSENNIRHKLGNVVKDWISERRENSRIEKLFSDSNILDWQILTPKHSEQTS